MSMSICLDAPWRHRLTGRQASVGLSLFHLTHLLQAGVALGDALEDVRALESGLFLRCVWADVGVQVQAGRSLSAAMSTWPRVFSSVVVALIRSGEVSGQLAAAVDDSRELLDWQRQSQAHLATALVYPLFALLVLAAVLAFLFVAVVPSLAGFLNQNQSPLPWHTGILLLVSDWLGHYLLLLVAAPIAVSGCVLGLRGVSRRARLLTDRFMLGLPLAGTLITELSLSRYASICGRLYRSGVTLDQSLAISESVIDNLSLRLCLSRVRASMVNGSTMGVAMANVALLPGSFKRLISAGESAGALAQALEQAGEQRRQYARHLSERLQKLAGPAVLLLVGTSLLWIITSILGPVYNAAIDAVLRT